MGRGKEHTPPIVNGVYSHESQDQARQMAKYVRYEGAATAYQTALERQPRNWLLACEVANFLLYAQREPAAALAVAQSAIALNPTCGPMLWNAAGDALTSLGRVLEARHAYRKALAISPNDITARLNLASLDLAEKAFDSALRNIAEGLSIDPHGSYRERFLQLQARVLYELGQRRRTEYQFALNRVTRAAEAGKTTDANRPDWFDWKAVTAPSADDRKVDGGADPRQPAGR